MCYHRKLILYWVYSRTFSGVSLSDWPSLRLWEGKLFHSFYKSSDALECSQWLGRWTTKFCNLVIEDRRKWSTTLLKMWHFDILSIIYTFLIIKLWKSNPSFFCACYEVLRVFNLLYLEKKWERKSDSSISGDYWSLQNPYEDMTTATPSLILFKGLYFEKSLLNSLEFICKFVVVFKVPFHAYKNIILFRVFIWTRNGLLIWFLIWF